MSLIEVYNDIYNVKTALANDSLECVNCYIVKYGSAALIIDTTCKNNEFRQVFFKVCSDLAIDFKQSVLFLTHLHANHIGLAAELSAMGTKVYSGCKESQLINYLVKEENWDFFNNFIRVCDLTKYNISKYDYPEYTNRLTGEINCQGLDSGYVFSIGEYNLEVIGSTNNAGSISLYERKHKLLFSGDSIVEKLAPVRTCWNSSNSYLAEYFNSLRELDKLEVKYVFSAHNNSIKNINKRIRELFVYQRNRVDEVLGILRKGERTISQVAERILWNVPAKKWKDFSKTQKYLAAIEAAIYLEYIAWLGMGKCREQQGVLKYSL